MDYSKQTKKPEKFEKQILGIFVFIGLSAIIFGFLQFRSDLKTPFYSLYTDINKKTDDQEQQEELLALKAKDTDEDGITDFDELYQYGTSPYIADTDSDGVTDGDEIKNNEDPNCPQGQECVVVREDTGSNDNTNSYIKAEDLSPEQLRSILAQNGVPQTTLDQLNDETLMQLYFEVIAETGTTIGADPADTNTAISNVNTDPYEDLLYENVNSVDQANSLADMSPETLRELLMSTGDINEAELAEISDDQLMTIYQESLKNEEIITEY